MITDEVPTTSARPRTRTGKRGLLAFFALLGILVAAAVAGGIVPRLARQKALLAAADSRAVTTDDIRRGVLIPRD